jgi:hypothetical protein
MVCADVLCTFYVKAFWQTPMRPVKWTLWPRAAPIWVEAVLLQSLPGYLSHQHHARSASLQELAGVFGSQGMTRARLVESLLNPETCNRATRSTFATMTSTAEEKAFLRVAVAAIPRIAEMIQGFPPDDQAGALESAEQSFMAAALDYGCTEITARSRVSATMRRLRGRLERQRANERKLEALLHRLTEPD